MVVCSHCNQEVEKYQVKRDKICKSCYLRMINSKHRGKEYIKLIDMNDKERNKIMNRRGGAQRKVTQKQSKIIKTNFSELKDIDQQKDIVMKDIMQVFENNNAKWPADFSSIIPVFKQLNILLHNYIDIYFTAENLLNMLETDYVHAKEYYSNLYVNKIKNNDYENIEEIKIKKQLWEDRHNAFLEIRRGLKNVIMEYNNGGSLFTHLGKDENFMKMFEDNYNRLMRIEAVLKDNIYKARASKLVEDEDFCVGKKTNVPVKERYVVTLKTTYKGVRNKTDFVRTVFAINEEDAKSQVIKYLEDNKDIFKFTYKSNDFTIVKSNDIECPRQ